MDASLSVLQGHLRGYQNNDIRRLWPALIFETTIELLSKLETTSLWYATSDANLLEFKLRTNGATGRIAYLLGEQLPQGARRMYSVEEGDGSVEFAGKTIGMLGPEDLACPAFAGACQAALQVKGLFHSPPTSQGTKVTTDNKKESRQEKKKAPKKPKAKPAPTEMKPKAKNKVAPVQQTRPSKVARVSLDAARSAPHITPRKPKNSPPTFRQVASSLRKCGFSFANGKYYRPGCHPTAKKKKKKLGKDYFDCEESFRQHLCEYGLDCAPDDLDEDAQELLVTWVRYAIVDPELLREQASYRKLSAFKALSLLEEMGVKRLKDIMGNVTFACPGVKEPFPYVGSISEPMLTYLCRFGLDKLDRSKIDPSDLLSLELFLTNAEPPEWTFTDLSKLDKTVEETRPTRKSPSARSDRTTPGKTPAKTPKKTPLKTSKKKSSPSPSVAASTNLSEGFTIPRFENVKKILQKCGFRFARGLYCRPGVDPAITSGKKLGVDYFDSEDSFRRDLCTFGVGVDVESIIPKEDDQEKLVQWIRYYIVDLEDESKIPSHSVLPSQWAAITLLRKIGLVRENRGIGNWYVLPGETARVEGVNEFREEGTNLELFGHLARFGTAGFDHTKITKEELLSLQLFLTEDKGIDTFSRIDNQSPIIEEEEISTIDRRSSRRFSRDEATVVTTESEVPPITQSVKKRKLSGHSATKLQRAGKRGRTPSDFEASSEVSLPDSPVEVTEWPDMFDLDQDDNISHEELTTPQAKREELQHCLERLGEATSARGLAVLRESSFGKKLSEIYNFVLSSANGSDGSSAIYVSGIPGVGKTTGIKWCLDKVRVASNQIDDGLDFRFCFVSATGLLTAGTALDIFDRLASEIGSRSQDPDRLRKLLRKPNGPSVVLVIDEIDHMVSKASAKRKTGPERVLEELFQWCSESTTKFTMIGISNSIGNSKFDRLEEIGSFNKNVTFQPYSQLEIESILSKRLSSELIEKPVIKFIGKKVEQTSGDARMALDYLAQSIRNCLEDVDSTKVKIAHANKVFRAPAGELASRIDGLPPLSKTTLCVAITLAQNDVKMNSMQLKKYVRECAMSSMQDEQLTSLNDFQNLFENLIDMGLLVMESSSKSADSYQQAALPIKFGSQLDEVAEVLKSELSRHEHYKQILAKARKLSKNV